MGNASMNGGCSQVKHIKYRQIFEFTIFSGIVGSRAD